MYSTMAVIARHGSARLMYGILYFMAKSNTPKNFSNYLSSRLKAYILPAVVFVTGACVLVIELVATRILAPFYGNTIFTVSSIIGVVLAALSIGYYVGGRLADKRPEAKLFYSIIAAGGASTIVLHLLSLTVLPYLSREFSITLGPLVTSTVLFLLPALLLGMLSPFAIKLQQIYTPEKGIGTIAGEMFFWSTLGSIVGSLATGFLLIPLFGVDRIILGVGFLLIALGIVPLILKATPLRRAFGILALVVAAGFVVQAPVLANTIPNTVYSNDGVYEKITIYDGADDGRPVRFFQQDRSSSGAMFLDSDDPTDLVYDYTKYYSLYKLFKPDTKQALVLGGGAYTIPKALLSDLPDATVEVSEIEPSLHRLGQQYFKVPETPRLVDHAEDGRRFLANSSKKHDLIFSDVYYSLYSVPSHFTTLEFFQLAHDRLNNDGVFIGNLIGNLSRQKPSLVLSEMRTFQKAFPNSYFFAVDSPNSATTQNIMFVGYKSNTKIDLNAAKVTAHPDPIISNLSSKSVDPARFNLAEHSILTDNYAPVEHLMGPLLAQTTNNVAPSGQSMMDMIKQQLSYGPRYVGSDGHRQTRDFIVAEASAMFSASTSTSTSASTPSVITQRGEELDSNGATHGLYNIILRYQPDNPRRIIVGAHYDSKRVADLDPHDPTAPLPGANDSASGVAVMLETARILAQNNNNYGNKSSDDLPLGVDFVFFDGEEGFPTQGSHTDAWRPLGSNYFADNLRSIYPETLPEGGLVVDMVCDRNLGIAQDMSSLRYAPEQAKKFWSIGNAIAPGVFQPSNNREVTDDHTALNRVGIPSFVVIDFDYPPWHTKADTTDKCSPKSLSTVSKTLLSYIRSLE